jgi:hypothetical protein
MGTQNGNAGLNRVRLRIAMLCARGWLKPLWVILLLFMAADCTSCELLVPQCWTTVTNARLPYPVVDSRPVTHQTEPTIGLRVNDGRASPETGEISDYVHVSGPYWTEYTRHVFFERLTERGFVVLSSNDHSNRAVNPSEHPVVLVTLKLASISGHMCMGLSQFSDVTLDVQVYGSAGNVAFHQEYKGAYDGCLGLLDTMQMHYHNRGICGTDSEVEEYTGTLLALGIDGAVSNAVKDDALEKALR